jgi:hypothetical protein
VLKGGQLVPADGSLECLHRRRTGMWRRCARPCGDWASRADR